MKFPLHASCQCGQVSYKLYAAPLQVMACHCQQCQLLSSGPFSVTAIVDRSDIEFSGEMHEWGRDAESGKRNHAKFCPGCGNRIYHFDPQDLSKVKLKLHPKNIADTTMFAPTKHIWVSEKLAWLQLPGDVPAFEKQS